MHRLPAPAPLAEPSAAGEIFFQAAPPETPAQLFPSLVVKPVAPVPVTPAITPENFQTTAQKLLSTARRSIRIEQQYVRGGQPAVEQLLKEIAAVRTKHPDVDIRLIVSPKYLEGTDREHFLAAMENYKLEFKTNYRFLSSRYFVHCHNKLIVVDEQKVLLGSQNWSSTGLLSNREASLLVEQGGIARYFGQIFDADWDMSETEPIPPEGAPAAGAIAAPADLAKGGVVRSTTADYAGV